MWSLTTNPKAASSPATTGTLEPGKDADFVAVRGNPLENIKAIHDVAAVFVRCTRVPMDVRPDP